MMTGEYYVYREVYKGEEDRGIAGKDLLRILLIFLQKARYEGQVNRNYLGLEVAIELTKVTNSLNVKAVDSSAWY